MDPGATAAHRRAAEAALAAGETAEAIAHATRGIEAGATGGELGALRLLQAEAHLARDEIAHAGTRAGGALVALRRGSGAWFRAVAIAIAASGRRHDYADVASRAREAATVDAADAEPATAIARVRCVCEAAAILYGAGRYDVAGDLAGFAEAAAPELARLGPTAMVAVDGLRAERAQHVGDLGGALRRRRAMLDTAVGSGDPRAATEPRVGLGFAHLAAGDDAAAEAELATALADAEAAGLAALAARARSGLAIIHARRGQHGEAATLLDRAIADAERGADDRAGGWARVWRATVALAAGDAAAAAAEATRAATVLAELPPGRAAALATLARARLATGDAAGSLALAQDAVAILDGLHGSSEGEALVSLALVDATAAAAPAQTAAVVGRARARLAERAATLDDPEARMRYLAVPEHARIAALAGDAGPAPVETVLGAAYDPDRFRREGHRVVDQLADYLARALAERVPVHPWVTRGEMLRRWRVDFPAEPRLEAGLGALVERVIADSQHQHHPGHMGHQVSAPLPLAALCDLVAAVLNNGMAAYDSGPAATAIEKVVVEELAARLGFPAGADGVLTSGGSAGNLTALLAARQVRAGYDAWNDGVGATPLAIVTSDQAHYSVGRAARILGLGSAGVIAVATDARYRMRPDAAAAAIDAATAAGRRVFAMVASACTTATGSIDPLPELAALAAERGIWLHVDAAHAAAAVLSPDCRDRLAGIERADSVVWDAHKMMLQPALVTAVLFRRGAHARLAFAQQASYLFDDADDDRAAFDLGLRTLECTKRMMGLKLYATLSLLGTRALGDYVAATFALAGRFAATLRDADDFALVCEPDANIVCFRYTPAGVAADQLDDLQHRVRERVASAGAHLIVQTRLPLGVVLRVTLANPFTEDRHLESLVAAIRGVR